MASKLKNELQRLVQDKSSKTQLLTYDSASKLARHFMIVRSNGITYLYFRCCKYCHQVLIYNSKSTTNLKRHLEFCMRTKKRNDETKKDRWTWMEQEKTQSKSMKENHIKRDKKKLQLSYHLIDHEMKDRPKKFKKATGNWLDFVKN